MRSVARRALTLGALAGAVLVWSGCEAKKQTEYVAGISTQVVVPRDLKAIIINVSVGGVPQFCRAYRVHSDGRVQLPRSLGEFPSSGTPGADPITVTVVGFTEELTDTTSNPVFNDCVFNTARVNTNNARILRRSRQPYVLDEVLFLPMPLKFSCFDKDCGEGEEQTCKAGRCESAATDEKTLPKFTADLIDGTGGACFSAKECFAAAVPAVLVDPNDCTYALPNTPSAPPLAPGAPANPITSTGDGINVEITYDGGYNREIIDKDPVEGFFVPDAAKPQRFRLAPGLCDMVKGVDPKGDPTPHRITAIRATGLCRAKGQFQPLCAEDQLAAMGTPGGVAPANIDPKALCKPAELKPAKSVLMILADDTENNAVFYQADGGGASDIAQSDLVSGALTDPAFSNTFIGLTFFPGSAGAACSPHNVDVVPLVARDARPQIISKFAALKPNGSRKPTGSVLNMRGALDDTYTTLKNIPDVNRRAVLVIGNRSFDTANSCAGGPGTPADRATLARTADKIDTYVGLFARDNAVPDTDPPPGLPGAVEVARAGEPGPAAPRFFDARKDKIAAANALRKIVDDLATCAYDVPTAPANDAVLTYSDPVAIPGPQKVFYAITRDAACTGNGAPGNGWGYNATTKRVHVCGKACDDYRNTLRTAAGYAAQYGQPSLAVPLFAHSAACAPK
jgi:hypothetical protein